MYAQKYYPEQNLWGQAKQNSRGIPDLPGFVSRMAVNVSQIEEIGARVAGSIASAERQVPRNERRVPGTERWVAQNEGRVSRFVNRVARHAYNVSRNAHRVVIQSHWAPYLREM